MNDKLVGTIGDVDGVALPDEMQRDSAFWTTIRDAIEKVSGLPASWALDVAADEMMVAIAPILTPMLPSRQSYPMPVPRGGHRPHVVTDDHPADVDAGWTNGPVLATLLLTADEINIIAAAMARGVDPAVRPRDVTESSRVIWDAVFTDRHHDEVLRNLGPLITMFAEASYGLPSPESFHGDVSSEKFIS